MSTHDDHDHDDHNHNHDHDDHDHDGHDHDHDGEEPTDLLDLLDEADALVAENDPEGAILLCGRALKLARDDGDRADVLLVQVEAEIIVDADGDRPHQTLARLGKLKIDDPDGLVSVGNVALTLRELDVAERAYLSCLEQDDQIADAHYGLGCIYEERGKKDEMVKSWLKVKELDGADPSPEWHLADGELEQVIDNVLSELPPAALDRLGNVPIMIEDSPSRKLIQEGCDPRILGLFSGTPWSDEVASVVPALTAIHIFQRNLENMCDSREDLEDEIRVTVLHETAHFFGLEDADLEAIGLG